MKLREAETALEGILNEQERFKERHDEALLRVQSCRAQLASGQEDLRETRITAVLDETAATLVTKKKKAVLGLQDELEDAEVQVIALSRKIAELEAAAKGAREALRRTKVEILLEKSRELHDQYSQTAAEYENIFRQLSVCVGGLLDLNAKTELKTVPGLAQFPSPVFRQDTQAVTTILQLKTAANGELVRIVPFLVTKEQKEEILAGLLS